MLLEQKLKVDLFATAPSVYALGWVKCREHISLLVILCIIVYVTNKAELNNLLIN